MSTIYFSKIGTGPNLVFLHGWKQDRHTWDEIVKQLKSNFTCWTLDLPGFGENPRPKKTWTPRDYAKWVGTFIQEHKISRPTVIGHSFGGRVAICLASDPLRYRIHDARFVFYATPGFREPLPRFTSMAQALARATKSWIPLHRFLLVKQIREKLRSRDFKEADNLQDIFVATIEYDLSNDMMNITSPTLLLWGENDAEVPLKIAQAMQSAIPHADIQIMPKTSHFAHLENPTLFAGIVKKFINS